MKEEREEGVCHIMGRQLNSISGMDVRTQKLQDIKRLIQTWDVQGGCLSEAGIGPGNITLTDYRSCSEQTLRTSELLL